MAQAHASKRALAVCVLACSLLSLTFLGSGAVNLRSPPGIFEVDDPAPAPQAAAPPAGEQADRNAAPSLAATVAASPTQQSKSSDTTITPSQMSALDTDAAAKRELSGDKPSDSVAAPSRSTEDNPLTKAQAATTSRDEKPLKDFQLTGTTTDQGNQTIVNATTVASEVPSVVPCEGCAMVNMSLAPFNCHNMCSKTNEEARKACEGAKKKPEQFIFHDCPNNCGGHGTCKMYFFHSDEGGWDLLPSNTNQSCSMKNEKIRHGRAYERVYHYCECMPGSFGPDCSALMPLKNRTKTEFGKKITPYYLRYKAAKVRAKYGEPQGNLPSCSNHGVFVPAQGGGLGACVCNAGWDGPLCERKTCPNNCHGNGICINNECVCSKGFMGVDCAIGQCPDECSGHGQCYVGKCLCEKGFEPPNCSGNNSTVQSVPAVDLEEKIPGFSNEPIDWEILNKTLTPGISTHEQVGTTQVKKDTSEDGSDFDALVKNVPKEGQAPQVEKEDYAPFATTLGGKQSNVGCHTGYYQNEGPLGQVGRECSGHGLCKGIVNDGVGTPRNVYRVCECFLGWSGDQCEVGSGSEVKVKDVVTSGGMSSHMFFNDNTTAPGLDMPLSNATGCKDNCTNMGVCLAREVDGNAQPDGYCFCLPGLSGVACELECPNKCNGHGQCSFDASVDRGLAYCDCVFPFTGHDCSTYGVNDTAVHISQVVESEDDMASSLNKTVENPDPSLGIEGMPDVVDLPSLPDHMKLQMKRDPLTGTDMATKPVADEPDLSKLSGPDGIASTTPPAKRADPPPEGSPKRHEGTPQ